jgi:hypothetical protein
MSSNLLEQRDHSPIRVGRLNVDMLRPAEDYVQTFAASGSLYFRNFLAADALDVVRDICRAASFEDVTTAKLGHMEVERPRRAGFALSMALSQPALLSWLEAATGRGTLRKADGRVAQARAGQAHQLDWHDDQTDPSRKLAITVDLSDHPYEGGLFELRERESRRVCTSHQHDTAGGALIFEVSDRFEHRILPVTAGGPRRVYTGWFYAPPAPTCNPSSR